MYIYINHVDILNMFIDKSFYEKKEKKNLQDIIVFQGMK
jgi:hypothetical protein